MVFLCQPFSGKKEVESASNLKAYDLDSQIDRQMAGVIIAGSGLSSCHIRRSEPGTSSTNEIEIFD